MQCTPTYDVKGTACGHCADSNDDDSKDDDSNDDSNDDSTAVETV